MRDLLLDVKIEDFSPEWDYTSGGAKLLICIKPSLDDLYEQIESKVTIRFGELDVPVRFLQGGVIKCNGKRQRASKRSTCAPRRLRRPKHHVQGPAHYV